MRWNKSGTHTQLLARQKCIYTVPKFRHLSHVHLKISVFMIFSTYISRELSMFVFMFGLHFHTKYIFYYRRTVRFNKKMTKTKTKTKKKKNKKKNKNHHSTKWTEQWLRECQLIFVATFDVFCTFGFYPFESTPPLFFFFSSFFFPFAVDCLFLFSFAKCVHIAFM